MVSNHLSNVRHGTLPAQVVRFIDTYHSTGVDRKRRRSGEGTTRWFEAKLRYWGMPLMAGRGVLPGYCCAERKGMPTPQREPLRPIGVVEREALQRIVSASSERVDQVRRATAILAVAHGRPFIQAAGLAGLRSGTTVADL